MLDNKRLVRKSVLRLREMLSKEEVRIKSEVIINRLISLEQFSSSKLIMTYVDFRNEVATRNFIKICLKSGKRVAVPLVETHEDGSSIMTAVEIFNMENDLEHGTYGILEPKREKLRLVEPSDIDLVVVPGVVFDINRNRIGYGAGYYDRFLQNVRRDCFKVGIAFEQQIIGSIKQEEHDVALDLVITEGMIL